MSEDRDSHVIALIFYGVYTQQNDKYHNIDTDYYKNVIVTYSDKYDEAAKLPSVKLKAECRQFHEYIPTKEDSIISHIIPRTVENDTIRHIRWSMVDAEYFKISKLPITEKPKDEHAINPPIFVSASEADSIKNILSIKHKTSDELHTLADGNEYVIIGYVPYRRIGLPGSSDYYLIKDYGKWQKETEHPEHNPSYTLLILPKDNDADKYNAEYNEMLHRKHKDLPSEYEYKNMTVYDVTILACNAESIHYAVNSLLNQLLKAYKQPALNDVKEVAALAAKDGVKNLMPWDFSYYSEKLKAEKYNVSDAQVKPYLSLEKVKKGVFGLAERLYGVTFHKIDVPVYNEAAECFEVLDADSSYLGLLYTDFFPREVKRPGAWMTEFKGQWREKDGTDSRPHIQIVMSFSKPIGQPGDSTYVPALLTYDECTTFLHEFGHSLHGLLTKCTYKGQSGTNVAHDFVELPSQFNENFMREKEFLDTFAADYQTGEKIPQDLVDRIQDASNFQAAYACVRQLSFGMLDMQFHTLGKGNVGGNTNEIAARFPQLQNIEQFEADAMAPTQVLPRVDGSMMATSFTHIFSGGYAAGYYGYKWAEMLDADAFAVFQKEGLFNPETAKRFRHLLESGDTVDPAELYRQFKGADPDINALMRRDGIIK